MPRVSAIFSTPTYRGSELPAEGKSVLIGGWHEGQSWGKDRYFVDLVGDPLALQLTGALAFDIKQVLGADDFDDFIDRWITIYPVPTQIKDKETGELKMVAMIRARACDKDQAPPRRLSQAKDSPPDDDIPF
ncbi:hypothetical protein [Bradyrhizobium sp. McL0616]|uniref:hypothetical protein n=1 Tax=Bradyrhizobium sp. McL0616 TaxID=3415674 RepID=UPI003CF2760D